MLGEYAKISDLAKDILGQKADLWNNWLVKFLTANQLTYLLPCVPGNVRLNAEIIEAILLQLLNSDPSVIV
jgi:hypothetical protein